MDQKSIEVLNLEFFPLFKVEFEETYRFREVDVDYLLDAEDHELLRKGHRAVIYIKEKYGDDWKVLYEDLSFNMIRAYLEIEEIKSNYSFWKSQFVDKPPVMFVYQNQVFKEPYVMMTQLCISGKPIEPHKYYTDEGSIKVDFFKSYVRAIPKNTVLIHAEQVYYNGELLYTREHLNSLGVETYLVSSIISFLKPNLPLKTPYEAEMESGYL